MKILVCIKQVLESASALEINTEKKWIADDDGSIEYRMNRFDEYALEEAVLIKERFPDVSVDVVSVGPDRVKDTLKRALGKGADNAIHINYPEPQYDPGYIDSHTVSSLIAEYAAPKQFDLIFAGVMSEDGMHCMVGPLIAASLCIPCAVSVIKEELNREEKTVTADCEMEGGMSEKAILELPALLTIQSGINHPRYPSLSNMLRSKSQKILTIDSDDSDKFSPGKKGDTVFSISFPERATDCTMIDGTADEKAERLLGILREKTLIK
ncbi:MAG: electron transfer flavoprotein subunit beta/FixA family protein [Deltaproteobacteria bacterium]|nr:electron transfer flavoprotein subunit beta/FixA family protein [Deltaproteobacteria bacterium]